MNSEENEQPGSSEEEHIEALEEEPLEEVEKRPRGRIGRKRIGGPPRKAQASYITFLAWAGFIIVWLFFFAINYDIWQKIIIGLVSLIVIGGVNGLMWAPMKGEPSGVGWRTRVSILTGIGWIVFLLIHLGFIWVYFDLYRNIAFELISFLLLIGINALTWMSMMPERVPSRMRRKSNITAGLLVVWLIFMIVWLLWFADGYTLNQNIAITLLSLMFMYIIAVGTWTPWTQEHVGRSGWGSYLLGILWFASMFVWFYFLADSFNIYQNFAIVLLSFLVIGAIHGMVWRNWWKDFEAMDWED